MLAIPTSDIATNRRMSAKKRAAVKTKVCSYFEAGNCLKGGRCDFLHGSEQGFGASPGNQAAARSGVEDPVHQLMPWLASSQGFASKPLWPSEGSECASTEGGEQSQPLSSVASEDGNTSDEERLSAKDEPMSLLLASQASNEERQAAQDEPMSLLMLQDSCVLMVQRLRL
jgi:hypothetical protein